MRIVRCMDGTRGGGFALAVAVVNVLYRMRSGTGQSYFISSFRVFPRKVESSKIVEVDFICSRTGHSAGQGPNVSDGLLHCALAGNEGAKFVR